MKGHVAVSFEDDLIKVVYASQDKGGLAVQQTLTFGDEQFDAFLKANKMPNISVVYPFRKFYSDIIQAPPVKKAYLQTIVEAEIKKRYPELNQFSFFYYVLADKTAEEKGLRDVFFFAVDHREIDPIVDRFDRYGKTIKAIYPDILSVSHFLQTKDKGDRKTFLGLLASNTDKSLFLVKNGQLRFIRITPSTGKDIQEADVDNINMTASYCLQQLRTNPQQVLLLNSAFDEARGKTVIPTVRVGYDEKTMIPEETFREFMIPLSAILFSDTLKNDNLLPGRYRVLYIQRFAVAYSIIFFLLFSLIGFSYLMINLTEISLSREKIQILRKELAGSEFVVAGYDKQSADLQQILPLINLIKDARSGPDIEKALAMLHFLPMENVDIQNIQLVNKNDALQMQIAGNVHASNFGNMHGTFQKLLNHFPKDAGTTILSRGLDLKSGQFQIEIETKTP